MLFHLFKYFIFVLFILHKVVAAEEVTSLYLSDNTAETDITRYASFYQQIDKSLTTEQLLASGFQSEFRPLTKKEINQGVSDDIFWVKLQLTNPTAHFIDWVLVHENSYLDVMATILTDENGQQVLKEVSDHDKFNARDIVYRKLNIRHTLAAGQETEVFIKLQMTKLDTINLALSLYSYQAFKAHIVDEQFYYGLYFGACIALIIISSIFAFRIKRALEFSYAIYLCVNLVFWLFLTGYIFQYVFYDRPEWFNQGFHIVYLLFYISAIQFSQYFLNTKKYFPLIYKLLKGTQIIAIGAIALRFAGVHELVLHISYLGLLLLALLPLIGIATYRKGEKSAKWYIVAWTIYGVTILISLLSAATEIFGWGMKPLVFTQVAGLLESFLLMMAVSDKVAQMNDKLIEVTTESQTDSLTGLGNRRSLRESFEKIQASTIPSDYWLVMLDIDDFKFINDNYGHDVGDRVLVQIANELKRSCRPEDIAVRFGGEEFILVVNAEDFEVVSYIAHRIKSAVSAHKYEHDETLVTTLSIGIAKLDFTNKKTISQSIKLADGALYYAKNSGKNQIALNQKKQYLLVDA